ncbi:hypothetical protein K505DRAFT_344366 [Melanomma pulvis-pyrius CBS 109.77]|uniref:Uncharacterized protein n=1 Tax=Melanomma pulvis-pyrius CBS 109.77 TaxID=1314802 RepID=A0A6A6WPF0_9PLEO|nr:hypothetical protein K505DRAFT_344366 [Melanomma pulvis-pyrius CBS 109.77]
MAMPPWFYAASIWGGDPAIVDDGASPTRYSGLCGGGRVREAPGNDPGFIQAGPVHTTVAVGPRRVLEARRADAAKANPGSSTGRAGLERNWALASESGGRRAGREPSPSPTGSLRARDERAEAASESAQPAEAVYCVRLVIEAIEPAIDALWCPGRGRRAGPARMPYGQQTILQWPWAVKPTQPQGGPAAKASGHNETRVKLPNPVPRNVCQPRENNSTPKAACLAAPLSAAAPSPPSSSPTFCSAPTLRTRCEHRKLLTLSSSPLQAPSTQPAPPPAPRSQLPAPGAHHVVGPISARPRPPHLHPRPHSLAPAAL